MFKRVPGTKDILPAEISQWQEIEERSRLVFAAYAYQEIRTPLIEDIGLYNRSLGEFTEIVQKQMFLIKNKEDTYVLRPEGTASVARAYIENNLDKAAGLAKFYYLGAMFRLERPQKGRLRQFHHIGAEVIGSAEPEVDIEVISLAQLILRALKVDGYEIQLNSLGCLKDKKELMKGLGIRLEKDKAGLCQDCRQRLGHNVLRILDCKNEGCQQVVKNAGFAHDHLCQECKQHFDFVKKGLDELRIQYRVNPYLVRGLDYYTRTVFEIKHPALGAQDAIGAGGRYDNLIKELGGPDQPAIGFAFGIERLVLAMPDKQEPSAAKKFVYIIGLGEEAKIKALGLAYRRRQEPYALPTGSSLEIRSLKSELRNADDLKASKVVIIGDEELKKGKAIVKDMGSGQQEEVSFDSLLEYLK